MRRAALAGAVLLALAGCGGVSEGRVVAKDHIPEHTWIYMQPIYTTSCSGNPPVCTQRLVSYVPITMTDPECWRLTLRNGDDHGDVCVDEATWRGAAPNDYYRPKEGG